MEKVKVFQGSGTNRSSVRNFSDAVNKWLRRQGEKIRVVRAIQSGDREGFFLTIFYTEMK
jgi:hypothetical protein